MELGRYDGRHQTVKKMQLLCYKKKNPARSKVAFLSDPSVNMEKEALRDGLTQ